MNPRDDPEERIRELERPLADAARASESGQAPPPAGYPYSSGSPGPMGAPPPSPWTCSGPPPRSTSGNRAWWILGTFIVIGFLALAGAPPPSPRTSFRVFGRPSAPQRTISGTFGPPSGGQGIPSSSPRPSTARSGTATPSASPAPPPGAKLSVSGIAENRASACNDNIVSVSGVSHTVVITDHCASLTVSGVRNAITVDAVDASGFDNKITYHSGSPKISNAGGSFRTRWILPNRHRGR